MVLIDNQADRLQFAKDRIPKLETINFSDKKARLMSLPQTLHRDQEVKPKGSCLAANGLC